MTAADPDALRWLRDLLQRYEGRLLRYAERFTHDPERARDVVQDTFCRLCQQPRHAVAGREAAWLFRVCRNRAIDVARGEDPRGYRDELVDLARRAGDL